MTFQQQREKKWEAKKMRYKSVNSADQILFKVMVQHSVPYLVERKLATLAIPLTESKWESIFGGSNRKFSQKPNFLVKDEEQTEFV